MFEQRELQAVIMRGEPRVIVDAAVADHLAQNRRVAELRPHGRALLPLNGAGLRVGGTDRGEISGRRRLDLQR